MDASASCCKRCCVRIPDRSQNLNVRKSHLVSRKVIYQDLSRKVIYQDLSRKVIYHYRLDCCGALVILNMGWYSGQTSNSIFHVTKRNVVLYQFWYLRFSKTIIFMFECLQYDSHDPCLLACCKTLEHTCRGFVSPHRRRARHVGGVEAAEEWSLSPGLGEIRSEVLNNGQHHVHH